MCKQLLLLNPTAFRAFKESELIKSVTAAAAFWPQMFYDTT